MEKGLIVLSVASPRIAQEESKEPNASDILLLLLGETTYSIFKILIDADETFMPSISKLSELAKLIRKTPLIIWDKAPMTHRNTLETVGHSL